MKYNIVPINVPGDYCTGYLYTTYNDIVSTLGFSPNVKDDPDKVEYSWGFLIDNIQCGIWDYKGSCRLCTYSTFGPSKYFMELFPGKYEWRK